MADLEIAEDALFDLVLGCVQYSYFESQGPDVDDLAAKHPAIARVLPRAEAHMDDWEKGPEKYAGGWDAWYARFMPKG